MISFLICSGVICHADPNLNEQVDIIITTIAGTGEAGFSGDGGKAINAQLHTPVFLSFDNDKNLLFCDGRNHVVRKISVSDKSNIISRVAGNGNPGYSGNGGPATDAQLEVTQGIAVDANNNIYISDGYNSRIRKVSPDGVINNFAGNGIGDFGGDNGLAVNAKLYHPGGLCVFDTFLYISDYDNNRIRRVNLNTNIITTVAGNGNWDYSGNGGSATAASLNAPASIACDKAGNIFIADQFNYAVRKVDIATGIITTVAGDGTLGYSGNGGLAVAAKLNEPGGLCFDSVGNLYIADYRNGAIRKVDAVTKIITTVVGGRVGYGGDCNYPTDTTVKLRCTDVKVVENGDIYIADYVNNRIRLVCKVPVIVNGMEKEIESKLFPNPTQGQFTIQSHENISHIRVCNVSGMSVYESPCTTTTTEVDISDQPHGLYMIYVQCGDKQYVSKVMKQ